MGQIARDWDGGEWQQYGNELLATHHSLLGLCYQRIPDQVDGDHGLEGIADNGDGYQSYSDQNTTTTEERTRKQKKKIYEDLKKLETYKNWWSDYLGDRKIRRWILMVPDVRDKEVVKYAKSRARELKKKGLPFISDDFDAYVKTQDDFPAARAVSRDPKLPRGTYTAATQADVEAFKKSQPIFVGQIDKKLEKAMPGYDEAQRHAQRDKLLKWHLDKSNFLDDLLQDFPAQWEDVDSLIRTTGESIETEGVFDARSAPLRLSATRRDFAETLKTEMPYILQDDRETVSWGTVSAWLGECPLSFPEVSNA